MADNRYIVTHSNYTIKKKHKSLSSDTIYERDYMTTTNLGGFDSGSIPYGEGNFRIKYNDTKNLKRRHKYGEWLQNENCGSGENCDVFTLDNMPETTSSITSEGKIELKQNKNTFTDFVYYGNAQEMVRSAIDDIIVNFPAELYVTNENYIYRNSAGEEEILGGIGWYIVKNDFNIDIISSSPSFSQKNSPTYNPLRFFCESSDKYRVINGNSSYNVDDWVVDYRKKNCFKDGDLTATVTIEWNYTELTIRRYFKDNQYVLLTNSTNNGLRIRPNDQVIAEFFHNIDDFGKFLLTRESNPIYTINVESPRETDRGITFKKETLTWPLNNGYNLDISSSAFQRYYESLISISEWYDENRVDNIWRNLTHESIKNMDRTYANEEKNEDNSDYKIGTTLVHDVLNIIGRQFDDIKRYIDNIKTINTITYDEKENTPDYFLSDTLGLSGWEVKSVVETLNPNTKTNILYSGTNKEYNINDANVQFFRNLKLNSKGFFSRKGTREGIEMLLSLFGFCSYDWARKYYNALPKTSRVSRGRKKLEWDELTSSITSNLYDYRLNEYVVTITGGTNGVVGADDELDIEKYSYYRKDFSAEDGNILQGLPVRIVYVTLLENDQEITAKYMIPWFSKKDTLDGNPYFQMFGGWGKSLKKEVTPNKELYPNTDVIYSISGFTIYDETKKYLKIVDKIGDLAELELDDVNDGDIFYVNDISDFEDEEYYPSLNVNDYTNYFTIKDKNKLDEYGGDGWRGVKKDELRGEFSDHTIEYKIIDLESIVEDSTGNNPHVGYGSYDDGKEFINYVKQVFRGAIVNDGFTDDAFDCDTGEILSDIANCGFAIRESSIDNMKTWFFTDVNNKTVYRLNQKTSSIYTDNGDINLTEYEVRDGYEISDINEKTNVGKPALDNKEVGFTTELSAFDLETSEDGSNLEPSANSIINVKNLSLVFNKKYKNEQAFEKYLSKVILPYIKQMIPSTTIFEVKYEDE